MHPRLPQGNTGHQIDKPDEEGNRKEPMIFLFSFPGSSLEMRVVRNSERTPPAQHLVAKRQLNQECGISSASRRMNRPISGASRKAPTSVRLACKVAFPTAAVRAATTTWAQGVAGSPAAAGTATLGLSAAKSGTGRGWGWGWGLGGRRLGLRGQQHTGGRFRCCGNCVLDVSRSARNGKSITRSKQQDR